MFVKFVVIEMYFLSSKFFNRIIKFYNLYGASFTLKYFLFKLFKINFKHKFKDFSVKTSDYPTIKEIFEIKIFDFKIKKPEIIVDVGSNIGLSLIWFSQKFLKAKIFGFEPDSQNYTLCKSNVKNKKNVKVFNYAIMVKNGFVEDFGEKGTNSNFFKESKTGKIKSITISELMELIKIKKIDLLKIDVEGAEKEIFSNNLNWLKSVENIFIETHVLSSGEDTKYIVFNKLLENGFYHKKRIYNVDYFSKRRD